MRGNPTGSTVVAGNVAFAGGAGTLDITQTGQAAIVNWQDFSIGAGETVTINQAANAALLNRVTGANPSELLGQLNADGRVFLVNPNGVAVGAGATIDVQQFIASTQDVPDAEFLDFANGDSDSLIFDGDSTASITNAGTITASDGDVILVGYKVANSGAIDAANGVAGLAAGKKVWFKPQSAQHIIIESAVGDPGADAADGTGVDNLGNISAIQAELKAAAANVYALAVNQTGMVEATGVANRNGRILLTTDEGTVAHTSGSLIAHNADGSGGEVLVGGDYHGLDPGSDDDGVYLAASTTIGAGATIDVSATAADANGGRAVVWSGGQMTYTGSTSFAGTINAKGGASGGNGGFAVVAGHDELDYTGTIDVSAAAGDAGTLVLGLPHATIANTASNDTANGVIANAALATQLASANVTIDAFGSWTNDDVGSIVVNGAVAWSSANRFTLKSGNNVRLNANLTAPNAPIEFQVMGVDTDSNRFSVYLDFGSTLTADRLTVGQNADSEFIGFNPPPEASRYTGFLNFQGAIKVGTLDLKLENGGIGPPDLPFEGEIDDAISLFNEANEIDTLTSSVTGAAINGNINIVDSTGDLTVSGDFSHVRAGANTSITTEGSLSLEGLAKFGASALTIPGENDEPDFVLGGEVVLAAKLGHFSNNSSAGAATLSLDAASRFLIYSDDPANADTGGIAGEHFYGASYDDYRPRDVSDWEGSFFFYSFQPTLTFTANVSRAYGEDNPMLDYSVTGLLDGDDLAMAFTGSPTLSTAATSSDGVGEYTINVAEGTVDFGNYGYQFSFAPGTLTINPAPLTIRADDKSKTVGGPDPAFTATFSGLVNGDTSDVVSGLVLAANNQPDSDPGNYTIAPSGATAPNYDITFVNGTLSIAGIPTLLISADDFDIRYGAAIPTLTASMSGFANGDDASIVSGLTLTTAAFQGSGVGTYAIVPAGATATGYDISYHNGTLTIDPALLTITANNLSRLYGAANSSLGVTYIGFVNGEDASVITGLNVTTAATPASDVGDYAIAVGGATAPNYAITQNAGTLTVNPAPLTIDVDDATKVYADLNPTFSATVTGFVLDDTLASVGGLALSTTATQLTDIGDYAINGALAGGAASGNYDVTLNPGTLTIVRRSVTAYANDVTRAYGDANPAVSWGLRGDAPPGMNLVNLIDVGAVTTSTAATSSSSVGVYAYNVDGIGNPNLDVTYEAGSITITPAPLTIKAGSASRVYGDDNPAFTSTTTGLKLTDTLADVVGDSAITTDATAASHVGAYAITPTGTVLNANYDVTFTPGTLTITKAPLFIAPALASRLYGDPDPAFTISATGLKNDDTTAVVTSLHFDDLTPPDAAVGSYHNVSIIGGTARDYALTFGTGTINVLARPLTITADSLSRIYGDPNPTLTASFDGLASFDDPSDIRGLTLATTATPSSGVQQRAITIAGGTNSNYDISLLPGTLTIEPAPVSFGVGSFYRTYGHTDSTITPTLVDGLKLADTLDDLGVSIDGPAPTADVGTYDIHVKVSNPNYAVTSNSLGTLQVLPAPIEVTVGNIARRYGDANPAAAEVPLTVGGLAFGQQPLEVLSLDFGVDAKAQVGNYPINAELISPNYQIAGLTLGNLAVLTRQLALKPENVIRYYGDDNPAYKILVAGDGLASFDRIDDVTFSNLLLVDSTLTDGLPSSLTDAGLHQLRIQPTGNPNYEIFSVPGLFVVLPRPITLTTADATATENRTPPTFSTTATNLVAGQTLPGAFPDLTYNVYTQDAPAAVGDPLTPTTYPIPDDYTTAAFRRNYPAEPAASRPPGEGHASTFVQIQVVFPEFQQPTVIRGNLNLSPIQLLTLNGTLNPATLGDQPTDDPQPVINYIQPVGYQSNSNYVVTAVHNGTLTIEPDPVIVAQKKEAAEAAAAANELANARAAFFAPENDHTAFGLPRDALPAFVNAVYNQVATERFEGAGGSELKEKIVAMLGLEPGSNYTEAQLYRLMAQIPDNLEVRALFAPVLDAHIRSLVDRAPDSYSPADAALVSAVNDRLAAQQASFASAARQAAQAEMRAYEAEQARTGADRNLVNLFGHDIPYDQIVKDALGSVVEDAVSDRLAGLIDKSSISSGANVALTAGVSAVGGTTAFLAAGSSVVALLPFSAGRGLEIATTVAEAIGAATGAGAAAGAVVATAVVSTVVMSIQRGIEIGDNEGQRLIYESLVNGTAEVPTLADINLDQTKGNGTKKLGAALNENLLSLAIFDIITG